MLFLFLCLAETDINFVNLRSCRFDSTGGVQGERMGLLGGVYSKEILGLDGRIEVVELLDDDGGSGEGSFPKPGSSFGSIFGEY